MPNLLLAVVLAGGLAGLNLAVPARSQEHDRSAAPPTSPHAPAAALRVDINHATVTQLMQVPGITRTWAARIVRFRPYRSKQDLLDQGVVTPEIYDRIKDFVIAHRDRP